MSATSIPAERDEFEKWCKDHEIRTVIAGSADTNGTWIAKHVSLSELMSLVDSPSRPGIGFSDVFLVCLRHGWDVVEPTPGLGTYFPNKESGFPDVFFRPDLSTARMLSWRDRTIGVNGSFVFPDGSEVPVAPRSVLAAQIEKAAGRNLEPRFATEFEFYLLNGSTDTLFPQNYPLEADWPRPNVYQAFRTCVDGERLARWEEHFGNAGIEMEAIHPENGPGQYELVIRYREAMRAADDAFIFKNGLKQLAKIDEKMATFIAVPRSDWPGSSCHVHQSLWSADNGEPLFHAADEPHHLSATARHYLGGMLATMKEFTALYRPTINAYKRARAYSWAGTTVSWGVDNRSTGVRLIGEDPGSCRFEHRVGGADVNPYLVMAACLAGGLYGIENEIEPPEAFGGDAYADDSLEVLPASLEEAINLFHDSRIARQCFGDDFVNHYTLMKRGELSEFASAVTDWEVSTYIETA